MKLNEVEIGKNVSDLEVRVVSIAPPRIVRARGGRKTQLTEVLVADATGTTILSLWGFGQGASLSAGMAIRITDGWAKEWQGKMQLSLGHSGKFEPIDDDGSLPSIPEMRKQKPSDEISE